MLKYSNYNDNTLIEALPAAIQQAREEVNASYDNLDNLISEVATYLESMAVPETDEEATQAMEKTALGRRQGMWMIIGFVHRWLMGQDAKPEDMDVECRFVGTTRMDSPRKVATYYLVYRSVHFLIDATQVAFAQSPIARDVAKNEGGDALLAGYIDATDENIDHLVDVIKAKKF